ncbi:hypothetical protein [Capnocytophaga sp. oral taxon 878]|uniref:hypothetical protein n=1 Tax=Capnocytophaga sp. oral taxon 878 TaxID=1316596 RepID=UPI000D03FF46|nr:hypothetical protein [Capnocytophaga sp. oral taxon 878]AVM49539.1 hypothetical protein C4H12_03125 [Capnocytophaga sp. oral taxon 878]
MKVAKYILGILLIITGLGVITQKSIIAGIAFVILGVVLLPTVSDKLKENVSFWQNKIVRYVSYIVLFTIAGATVPKSAETSSSKEENKPKIVIKTEENTTEQEPATAQKEEPLIKYEIQEDLTTVIHYDKAPSYFVLIDKVNLKNDSFVTEIERVINKIVSEKGGKITIDFFDNKKALELYYNSNYGINIGELLNKSENNLLAQHSIASFSGENSADMHYNTLYIFPAASKDNPNVGKYVKTKEFNPNVK